jgi:hypothetical protein
MQQDDSFDDDDFVDDENSEGEVVVSKRYSYTNHRRSRFEHKRETDDPASDSDENIRRLAAEMQGGMNLQFNPCVM